MNAVDKMTARAQIILSAVFLGCVFAVVIIYELGYAHLTADQARAFDKIIDWLESAAMVIVLFWFQRLRTSGIPDVTPTVTQEHQTPDGSKVTITSPAHLPLPPLPNPTRPAQPAK